MTTTGQDAAQVVRDVRRTSEPSEHDLRGEQPTSGGHGGHHGHHGAASLDDMARDLRNRSLVAALLSLPILLFSPIGRDVLGFEAAARASGAERSRGESQGDVDSLTVRLG